MSSSWSGSRYRAGIVAFVIGAATAATVLTVSPARADPTPSLGQVQQTIGTLQAGMKAATEQYNQARDAIDAAQDQRVRLSHSLAALRPKLAAETDRVAAFAALAYRGADVGMLTAVISSGSPEVMIDQLSTLQILNHLRRAGLDSMLATQNTMNAQRAALAMAVNSQNRASKVLVARQKAIVADLAKWQQLRDRYYPRASRDDRVYPRVYDGPATGRARIAVTFAYAQMGKPYKWGADGPGSFDCSGLTMASWRKAGVSMPHSAKGQYQKFRKVSMSALRPGDLVYYPHHIALYVGDGEVVHAPEAGDVVRKVPVEDAGGGVIGAVRPS